MTPTPEQIERAETCTSQDIVKLANTIYGICCRRYPNSAVAIKRRDAITAVLVEVWNTSRRVTQSEAAQALADERERALEDAALQTVHARRDHPVRSKFADGCRACHAAILALKGGK